MSARVFLDTNVLLYASDERDPAKYAKARAILDSFSSTQPAVISTQVLQEFYSAATRKIRIEPAKARSLVLSLRRTCTVHVVTPERVIEAIDCSILNQISLWDALVVVCASATNCDELWTEDLNPGQIINGVKIVNPFPQA